MQEYRIDCVMRDEHGVITYVHFDGKMHWVSHVALALRNQEYRVYTLMNGSKAIVYPKRSDNGNWFLITSVDGVTEHKLDFLPTC